MIKVTEVKVYPVKFGHDRGERDNRLKAYATIVFENSFIVRDLKVILGNDGNLFVSMPSGRSKYGSFRDIAHPLNSTLRSEIETSIFAEYDKMIKLDNSNENDSNENYDI